MAYFDRQPVIYPLQRLLEEILSGEIRVPQFQRPGTEQTWSAVQRGDLIDSILRQFPIGTIMLWSTELDVKCLEVVGGAAIPERQKGRPLRLVLDGHQRLSTLVRLLGPALKDYRPAVANHGAEFNEDWRYNSADLKDDKPTERDRIFNQLDVSQGDRDEFLAKAIPLAQVLDRIKVNSWIRTKSLTDNEIAKVDALRDGIREYQVPVVTLVASTLEEATESFSRVNSSGTPMSPKHMVGALAYSNDFDLFEAIRQQRAEILDDLGWGALDDTDLLRICAGLLRERDGKRGHHPARLAIAELAKELKGRPQLVSDAVTAATAAARLLGDAGVHGPEVLPYVWQIIILAIALESLDIRGLSEKQHAAAMRWFWRTTYGAVFQGVNSAIVDRALQALLDTLHGGDDTKMHRDISSPVSRPEKCDFRTMRTRAALLAMAREQDHQDVRGFAHRALTEGTDGVMQLFPAKPRSELGNLHIEHVPELRAEVRSALKSGNELWGHKGLEMVAGLGDSDAGQSPDEIIKARGDWLWEREQQFIKEWDLKTGNP